ncbi:unnamed protein product, partial [Pelagomonas calceolata]
MNMAMRKPDTHMPTMMPTCAHRFLPARKSTSEELASRRWRGGHDSAAGEKRRDLALCTVALRAQSVAWVVFWQKPLSPAEQHMPPPEFFSPWAMVIESAWGLP